MQPDVRERRFRTSYRADDEKEWEVSMKKGKMKLMIAPLQGSVNDTEQVLEKIVESCRKAIAQKADLLCFPELILNGADPEALGSRHMEGFINGWNIFLIQWEFILQPEWCSKA